MKLRGWGGIVPWIGFRRVAVPCEVAAEVGIRSGRLVDGSMDEIWVDAFEIEWLGAGVMLTMRAA